MIARDSMGVETWLLSLPPTRQQTHWVIAIAVCQVAALALLAPFAGVQLAQINGFIPAFEGVIFVTDLVTSVLLFSQFAIHRQRALLVLACGYLFSALMIIPHVLTYPGAFSPTGLLGAGRQTPAWLFWFWHLPFAAALLGYGLMRDEKPKQGEVHTALLTAIGGSVALVVALASGLTLLATAGHDYLPVLLADKVHWASRIQGVGPVTILVGVSALVVLWRRQGRSLLDHWLMVVALAAILEAGFVFLSVFLSSGRFTVGFYAGRLFSLLTSTIVLVVLLTETMRLYGKVARSSEAKIRRLVDSNMIGICLWRLDGTIVDVNEAFLRIMECDREDIVSPSFRWTEVTPELQEPSLSQWQSTGIVQPFEREIVLKSGVRRSVLIATSLFEQDGDEGVAFLLDLTERKEMEEALRQSEQSLRSAIDGIPGFVGTLAPNGDVEALNRQILEYSGQTLEELKNWGTNGTMHYEDLARVADLTTRSLAAGVPYQYETRLRRYDGEYRWFDVRNVPERDSSGRIARWYGLLTDIEDRKRAEEALRESERKLRSAIDGIPGLVSILAPDGTTETVNRQILEYCGQSLEELRNWATNGTMHPEDLDVVDALTKSVASGIPYQIEHRLRRFDGEYRWFDNRGVPACDDSGRIVCWYVLLTDIEERKRAEGALRESERLLRSAIDGIPGLVGVLTPNGAVETVNRQILEYTGQSLEELRDWGTNGTVHHDDLPHVADVFTKAIVSGVPYQIEHRLRRFDGVYRWFDNRGIPIRDDSGGLARWYVLLTDIEDRAQTQAQLQQMQSDFAHMNRVSMMGELAASLSHEITQPIASARNNARAAQNFLDMQPPELSEVREALGCVVADADRAGDIIGRIRDHIKKAPPRKERFNLNEAINEVVALARSAIIRSGVSAQARLADGLFPVHGDRGQLQQVVLNLVLNAVEAMGSVEAGPRELLISTEQDNAGVLVTVRDTGPGIDPTQLERVFEAFYTTKSNGVGMGLSICRSIINAHGGRLWAEANEPRGAVFQFTLPETE